MPVSVLKNNVSLSNGSPASYCTSVKKDVVIIGNGPSALSLSAFLSGYEPFYDSSKPHPNVNLRKKLEASCSTSILSQDFEYLSSGLEGRSNRGVALLYDSLCRPDADLGEHLPPCLKWSHPHDDGDTSSVLVDHVCLGEGPVGGSWQRFAPDLLTLSFGSWLNLPAYSFRQWLVDQKNEENGLLVDQLGIDPDSDVESRVPCWAIAKYYNDYACKLKIKKRFLSDFTVTAVERLSPVSSTKADSDISPQDYNWSVAGVRKLTNQKMRFLAKKVVLACGAVQPKRLNVPNENLPLVFHTNGVLECVIERLKKECVGEKDKVKLMYDAQCVTQKKSAGQRNGSVFDLMAPKAQRFEERSKSYTCHKEWLRDFCRKSMMSCGGNVETLSLEDIRDELALCYKLWVSGALSQEPQCPKPHVKTIFGGPTSNSPISALLDKPDYFKACPMKPRFVLHCDPVLVVGDGLSAADAISRLLVCGIPVLHSFRKMVHDPRHLFAKLSRAVYPDYHSVYELMTSKRYSALYAVYPGTEVVRFDSAAPGKVVAEMRVLCAEERNDDDDEDSSPAAVNFLTCSAVVVDIGSEPDLSFMLEPRWNDLTRLATKRVDSRSNPIQVDQYTSRCLNEQHLYALGPLIGDNYVRYIVGGAMACAADLLKCFSARC